LSFNLKQGNQDWLEKNLTAYLVSGSWVDKARAMAENYIKIANEELSHLPQGPWIENLLRLGSGLNHRLNQLSAS
jgi:hypothetical protein